MESSGGRDFIVSNWKSFEKNTLRGFFSVTLPSGLTIHNCSLHVKGPSRWVGLPSTKFTKKDGSVSYSAVVEIVDRERADEFRDAVIAALDLAGMP
jgi:hypothetical protein